MFSFYIPPEHEASSHRGDVMRRLRAMIDYARENDVVLLHENEKDIYGDNAERCLDLFETLGCEHFKCTFDFANFVQVGQDTLEAYQMLKHHIAYIHVKDALLADGRVVPAGEGDGHVEEILRKLDAEKFRGFLSLEPHLAIFDAYKGIERGGKEPELTDGAYAWKTAYEAAVKLLGWQAKA
jgi:sugar phosphate isomerase/epimerase